MDSVKPINIGKTLLGIPIAFIAWLVVFVAAHIALYLLDSTRGLADDWIQSLFREWFTPGVGGYAAIFLVNKYLYGANLKWVAIGFCSPIVIFYIGFSLYIIIFHGSQFDFSWAEQITNWGMAIATSIGAYIGYSKYGKKETNRKKDSNYTSTYSDSVNNLLNHFSLSITLLKAQDFDALSFIDYSKTQNYTTHESALGIARSYADIQTFTDYDLSQRLAIEWAHKVQDWIKEGLVSMDRVKTVLTSLEDLSMKQANKKTETASVKIYNTTPNMPDITAMNESLSFEADDYNILFGKNVPSIASHGKGHLATVEYLYIMVVVHKSNGMPQYFVTLEKGITGGHFLCTFDKDSVHNNYGKDPKLDNEGFFVVRALEIIKEEFMFEHIKESKPTE